MIEYEIGYQSEGFNVAIFFLTFINGCSTVDAPVVQKQKSFMNIKDKNWKNESSIDPMSGNKSYSAMNLSLNEVKISYPVKSKTKCGFGVTKKEGETSQAILAINSGVINYIEGRWIRVKFDELEPEEFQIREFGNGQGGIVVLEEDKRFWTRMTGAKKMSVELLLYGDGLKSFHFQISELQCFFLN